MNRSLLILILFACVTICSGKEYKDTLWTTDDDRIIITYDLRYNDDGVEIKFLDVQKNLSRINSRRYKRTEDVEVVFFDRTGVYEDVTFTNITPEAFMVPSNLKYSKSDVGYFFIQDNPSLSFRIIGNEKEFVSIPIYLTYYEGKGKHKIFSTGENLDVTLLPKTITTRNDISETVIPVGEVETDSEYAVEVSNQIKTIMVLLEAQTKLPFTDGLQYEIISLRNLQKDVKDRGLLSNIKECLTSCELKKIELEEKAASDARREQMAAEKSARLEREREQARQDSIAAVQQKQAESEKKRNIWMIVGGLILAAVCFIVNQVFLHFRNIRNQRSMMELQQDIARRAENEAKRHVQNYTRKKTNEVVNSTRRTAQEMMRNKVKQSGGNKPKNISI